MQTIPDSNVVLDLLTGDKNWYLWSSRKISEARAFGGLLINPIVYSEAAAEVDTHEGFMAILKSQGVAFEELPWEAAFAAGKVHRAYRQAGGERLRTLPDFLVGAHAALKGYRILTRDASRYRTYFPDVDVIAPDTHP
jgi:predicted nucleic acid-binding protein